MSEHLFSGIL